MVLLGVIISTWLKTFWETSETSVRVVRRKISLQTVENCENLQVVFKVAPQTSLHWHAYLLSLIHTCKPNVRMCGRATNMRCTIYKQFAYCSPWTEVCQFFVWTQSEFGLPGVLCSLQVCGKLIYHVPSANCSLIIWFTCDSQVYTGLNISHSVQHIEC